MASIYLDVNHYKDDQGVERIDIVQTLTGGMSGTTENRTLDWTEREHEDHLFGPVLSKSRRAALDEIEREWLKKDWLNESFVDGQIINTTAKSNTAKSGKTWLSEQVNIPARLERFDVSLTSASQVWGLEQVNGEKRYTRHVYFEGPKGEVITVRLVYDYRKSRRKSHCELRSFHPGQRVPGELLLHCI